MGKPETSRMRPTTTEIEGDLTMARHEHEARVWAAGANYGSCVYIAGPMAGQPDHGYDAFYRAESRLWALGLVPLSPARGAPPLAVIQAETTIYGDFRKSPLYATMMRRDFGFIIQSKALFMLPGWEQSQGATIERQVGVVCGCKIFDGSWLLLPD